MLSGKTVARAHRAHILTENALSIKLHQIALSEIPDSTYNASLEVIQKLYETVEQRGRC